MPRDESCSWDCAGSEQFGGRGEFASCGKLEDCEDCVDSLQRDRHPQSQGILSVIFEMI